MEYKLSFKDIDKILETTESKPIDLLKWFRKILRSKNLEFPCKEGFPYLNLYSISIFGILIYRDNNWHYFRELSINLLFAETLGIYTGGPIRTYKICKSNKEIAKKLIESYKKHYKIKR
jgi:hypothetical protein